MRPSNWWKRNRLSFSWRANASLEKLALAERSEARSSHRSISVVAHAQAWDRILGGGLDRRGRQHLGRLGRLVGLAFERRRQPQADRGARSVDGLYRLG